MNPRYVHTNLIARDWKRLAQFYQDVFGCVPVPPERDYSGEAFDRLTNLEGARQRGMHLRLPGWGDDGPTLELFEYTPDLEKSDTRVNRHGFGHVAFTVDNVHRALERLLGAGGGQVGEVVRLTRADGRQVTVVYATDPEGNVVELQRWSRSSDRITTRKEKLRHGRCSQDQARPCDTGNDTENNAGKVTAC